MNKETNKIQEAAMQAHWDALKKYITRRGIKFKVLQEKVPDAAERIAAIWQEAYKDGEVTDEVYKATQERELQEIKAIHNELKALLASDTPKEKEKPAQGLSDGLAATAVELKIKKPLDWFDEAGHDRACEQRREYLNRRYKYTRNRAVCMNDEQWTTWATFRKNRKTSLTPKEQKVVVNTHAVLFDHKPAKPCSGCPETWKIWIDQIDAIYKSYLITDRAE